MKHGLGLAIVLAACGGGGGGAVPIGDLQSSERDAACAWEVKCGLYPDLDTCRAYTMSPTDPNPQAAVDANKMSYSGTDAKQCFDALAASACDQTQQSARVEPASCRRIFTGKQLEGEPCAFAAECKTGVCIPPGSCAMACCQGTCGAAVPQPQIGQSCASAACADGAYCDETSTCRALLAQGGACASPDACQYGLGCVGLTPGANGTCEVVPTIGQPCAAGTCADVGSVCNTSGMCVALGLPGDPCALDLDCAPAFHCDATQHCNPYPSLGMPCTSTCAPGAWCDAQSSGMCVAPLTNGQPCQLSQQCQSEYCDQLSVPPACADLPMCF
jgi:hypothetical protein